MAARGLPERGNATIINWAQATATTLTEALEDVFGRVIVSTPETVSQFVVLKTEYLASTPVQAAHNNIMAAIPALVTGNTTIYQLVLLVVSHVQGSLLDAVAELLTGRKFTAYVDQGSLGWLKDKSLSSVNNRRLQASFAYLRQFCFDLLYKKSKEMQDVDALSRVGASDEDEAGDGKDAGTSACCVEVQQVTPETVAAAAVTLQRGCGSLERAVRREDVVTGNNQQFRQFKGV
jgi:hypothetical protein